MTALLPAHLTETLNNLGDAARALADEVRADKQQRELDAQAAAETQRKHNRRMITLLVIVAVLVAGLAMLSISNRRLGQANSNLNRQNARIVERIESCTTVGGECYEQSAERTQDAIRQLMLVDIAVAQCSNRTDTDAELEECVTRYVAKAAAPTTPPASEPPAAPSGTPEPSPSD